MLECRIFVFIEITASISYDKGRMYLENLNPFVFVFDRKGKQSIKYY